MNSALLVGQQIATWGLSYDVPTCTTNVSQATALTPGSQISDTLALTSNSSFPSNLSIVESQDIGVGGIYVRTNTLTYTATGVTVTNKGPYN
jgi:hypothetical protein